MRALVFTLLLASACGTQYADPILAAGAASDACAQWIEESACLADLENGCSFQPNPLGCSVQDASCAAGICRSGDPFVRRSGATLRLRGAPYRFTGAVSWGIAWGRDTCQVASFPDQEQALVRVFDDLAEMHVSVLKIWAYQYHAGDSGTDYSKFDRVVMAARRAGVRLIFVLENHWGDCSLGGARNDAWYAGGYASPYGGYALSFPDYVQGLVVHFKNEPTLLAWEIMHEAGAGDFAALSAFFDRMTSLIRGSDSNHLIAIGADEGNTAATGREGSDSNYQKLHAQPAVDLLDVHDFTDGGALTTPMSEIGAIAAAIDKPVFAGATAVTTAGDASSLQLRATLVEQKLSAALSADYAGFLVYDYYPDWTEPGWDFDSRSEDPLGGSSGVLARHAFR